MISSRGLMYILKENKVEDTLRELNYIMTKQLDEQREIFEAQVREYPD